MAQCYYFLFSSAIDYWGLICFGPPKQSLKLWVWSSEMEEKTGLYTYIILIFLVLAEKKDLMKCLAVLKKLLSIHPLPLLLEPYLVLIDNR